MERYQTLGRIGEGTYGVVFKAKDKVSQRVLALKQIRWRGGGGQGALVSIPCSSRTGLLGLFLELLPSTACELALEEMAASSFSQGVMGGFAGWNRRKRACPQPQFGKFRC